MSDILNLALKKDVYEGINNGTTDKIVIEWSNWWNKRLKDIDTGKFKDFVAVRISCGSAVKLDYPIVSIEQINRNFVITVDNQGSEAYNADDVIENTETQETGNVETQIEDTDKFESVDEQKKDEYVSPEIDVEENPDMGVDAKELTDDYVYEIDLKKSVNTILDNFCKFDNVYNINAPVVNVLPSGRIVGSSKRLAIDRDCETRIPFENVEFVKYRVMTDREFLDMLNIRLTEYLNGKYIVFINKRASGFTKRASGEDVLVLRMVAKKSYLLGR